MKILLLSVFLFGPIYYLGASPDVSYQQIQSNLGNRFEYSRYLTVKISNEEWVLAFGKTMQSPRERELIFYKSSDSAHTGHPISLDQQSKDWLGDPVISTSRKQYYVRSRYNDPLHIVRNLFSQVLSLSSNSNIYGSWRLIGNGAAAYNLFTYSSQRSQAFAASTALDFGFEVSLNTQFGEDKLTEYLKKLLTSELVRSGVRFETFIPGERSFVGLNTSESTIYVTPIGRWKDLLETDFRQANLRSIADRRGLVTGNSKPNDSTATFREIGKALAHPEGHVLESDGMRQDPFFWLF